MSEEELWDAVLLAELKNGICHEWAIIGANAALKSRRNEFEVDTREKAMSAVTPCGDH